MIEQFTKAWFASKDSLRGKFAEKHPSSYREIVHAVVTMLADASDEYDKIDPEKIHQIDDGGYQGVMAFVIGSSDYESSRYWYVKVAYGSCSGCDTLEGIRSYEDGQPDEQQVEDYMTLALHIVQRLREMEGEAA